MHFYKGRNVLSWALINDEKFFGVRVQYIDEGIDTVDIILQRYCEINDNDDYATLLEKAYKKCAEVLYDSLNILKHYEIGWIKQTLLQSVGFYGVQRKEGDKIISWIQQAVNFLTLYAPFAAQDRWQEVLLQIVR